MSKILAQTILATGQSGNHHYRRGSEPDVLALIDEWDVNLCLWERSLDSSLAALTVELADCEDFNYDLTVDVKRGLGIEFITQIKNECQHYGEKVPLLVNDINLLIRLFGDLSRVSVLRLRLDSVHTPSCSRFHRDNVSLRALCTYAGPGTQWLTEDNINEEEMERGGSPNEKIVRDMAKIQTARAGDVLVMKGGLYSPWTQGIVHRSWPVCCADDRRLRLCLDVVG